jgi:hypothetical protein
VTANGQLQRSDLAAFSRYKPLPNEPVGPLAGYLRADAARQAEIMDLHYFGTTGRHLRMVEGYRSLPDQENRWDIYENGGNLAAWPGTSKHGWGLSGDWDVEGRAWLHANGPRFGWSPSGLKFKPVEPWHSDYIPGLADITTFPASSAPAGDTLIPIELDLPQEAFDMHEITTLIFGSVTGGTAPYLLNNITGKRRRLSDNEVAIIRLRHTKFGHGKVPEMTLDQAVFDGYPKEVGSL